MISDRWALFVTPDDAQHLVFLHEAREHRLHRRCACRPYVKNGIVVHAIVTAVVVPQHRPEKEH